MPQSPMVHCNTCYKNFENDESGLCPQCGTPLIKEVRGSTPLQHGGNPNVEGNGDRIPSALTPQRQDFVS
jgi:hypothetical protein